MPTESGAAAAHGTQSPSCASLASESRLYFLESRQAFRRSPLRWGQHRVPP